MKTIPASVVKGIPAFAQLSAYAKAPADLSGYKGYRQPVLADSLEVIEDFYREKLQVLEGSLTQLNILENSREIAFLCLEISGTKKALLDVFRKKK